jgi:hypothetical protein
MLSVVANATEDKLLEILKERARTEALDLGHNLSRFQEDRPSSDLHKAWCVNGCGCWVFVKPSRSIQQIWGRGIAEKCYGRPAA